MTNTADNTMPAIEAFNLTKVYGSGNTEVVAMKNVSLTVARGEVVALLGPSGAGKSTLLTAIGLINPPTAGRILIGGQPVMDADRALVDLRAFRRQHLGFIFQKANLIAFLNAAENVQVALDAAKALDPRIQTDLIDLGGLNIAPWSPKPPEDDISADELGLDTARKLGAHVAEMALRLAAKEA